MNKQTLKIIVFSLVGFFANVAGARPHMDLEMTGPEYQQMIARMNQRQVDAHPLHDIVDMGARNLNWLKMINSVRPEGQKLSFTSAATQTGIPIEAPKMYNAETIRKDFDDLFTELPVVMADVLLAKKEMTTTLPMDEASYIEWGRKANRVYESATRWITLEPWLGEMAESRVEDIRGYYFLSKDENRETNLNNFVNLSEELKAQYKEWMLEVCANVVRDIPKCRAEVEEATAAQGLVAMYNKYAEGSKAVWDGYFNIPDGITSSAMQWNSSNQKLAVVNFKDPEREDVRQYLKVNIEDEWKWNDWKLAVNFEKVVQSLENVVQVVWQPGATPHVPGLGVNQIVMDGNSPLTEYNVQWTIRHEFGHVIGFPDCYLEFFDTDQSIIISYQHDITNLMCSRKGHLKDIHFTNLKRVYLK